MALTTIIKKLESFGFSAVRNGNTYEITHSYTGTFPTREAVSVHDEIRAIVERFGFHAVEKNRFAATVIY